MVQDVHNEWLKRAQSFVRDPLPLPLHTVNNKIIKMMDTELNAQNVLKIVMEHVDDFNDVSMYNKAMQKCGMLKDWKSVHVIMELLLSSFRIKPDLISFNIFINNMALSDSPHICIKYLKKMIKEYHIKPDVITFSSIIKSLRRQNKCKESEKCWKLMTKKYKLKPHNIVYCEMISMYSRIGEMEKNNTLFNEYMTKVKRNDLQIDVVIFNAYLNGFSRFGDIEGMQNTIKLFEKYGLHLTQNTINDIMRGYIKANQYKECIKLLKQWTDYGNAPNINMIHLKCIALVQMISIAQNKEKYSLYLRLKNTIYCELKFYGLNINTNIARTQLNGAIFLYQYQPIKVIPIFESLIERGLIGYKNYDKLIDLHLFTLSEAQFIIRYLFGFKLNQIIQKTNDSNLEIIVGKGKHSIGKANNNGNMKRFIINELMSWNPPIRCVVDTQNTGKLLVKKSELMPYLKTNMKFTMTTNAYKDILTVQIFVF